MPASKEPRVSGLPPSKLVVSSPKYQTLPARSCANHSSVNSISLPFGSVTRERITRAVTPSAISFVRWVTTSTILYLVPSGAVSR
jgi:hypothetical protein